MLYHCVTMRAARYEDYLLPREMHSRTKQTAHRARPEDYVSGQSRLLTDYRRKRWRVRRASPTRLHYGMSTIFPSTLPSSASFCAAAASRSSNVLARGIRRLPLRTASANLASTVGLGSA